MAPRSRLPFYGMLTAAGVSMLGTEMTVIGVPWYVLVTTGSPARAGLVGFFTVLAEVASGILSGAIVDRLGRRTSSIVADLGSATAIAVVPVLAATAGLQFWQLVVLISIRSLFDAPGSAARTSLVVDAATRAGIELPRANSAAQAVTRGAGLVGAPVAGILIAVIGPANILWFDAASFALSAAIFIAAVPGSMGRSGTTRSEGYLADLRGGFRAMAADPLVRSIVLLVVLTNFLEAPMFSVITPVYARSGHGGATGLGILVGALSLGGVLGALLYGQFARWVPRGPAYIAFFTAWGVSILALAMVPGLAIPTAIMLFGGFAAGPLNVIITTALQERIAPEMHARVFATARASAYVAIPLGVLAGGFAVQSWGVTRVLIFIGTAYTLTALSMGFNRHIRGMRAPAAIVTTPAG